MTIADEPVPDAMDLCRGCGAAEALFWDRDDFLPAADREGWRWFAVSLNNHAADCPNKAPWE
ncbi:MAG TPA: hypothetical protein VME67_19520 [Mycobacterium sp.]|nr:hypothetical protein [Mycobacterium sp.]HTX96847.1 hypothetical protein [Mycobacterium sp.]